MSQRETIQPRNRAALRNTTRVQHAPSEEILWEMAFVLHLTQKIKDEILAEKYGKSSSTVDASFSCET